VREILYRELYRGIITWNRTQKIIRKGTKGSRRRDQRDWLTVPAPELRIVSEDLWNAAHARLTAAGGWFARMRQGGKLLGRPSFTDSQHLLTGFTTCAICGGSIVTEGRRHGSPGKRTVVRFYGCTTNRRSGDAACANRVVLRQEVLESAVLDDIARKLHDRVESAIDLALARLRAGRDEHAERRSQIDRELAQVDQRIQRGLDALLDGAGLADEIHPRLRAEKSRKASLTAELDRLRGLEALDVDAPAMRAQLMSFAEDVRALLSQDKATPIIRQALRKVLDGKIVAAPDMIDGRPAYRYQGRLTIDGLLSGEAIALARSWWPQRGSNPCFSLERAVS
jgi:site-specific DNA recombinase